MKFGILTFHSANNYGAVIQCYSFQEYLRSLGHDVYVIDYRPTYLGLQPLNFKSIRCNNPLRYLARALVVLYGRPKLLKRNKNFENFRNKYLRLIPMDYLGDENSGFDAFFYGSDQIWEWGICHGYDDFYFAKFNAAKNALNITYAASLAKVNMGKEKETQLCNLLSNYSSISVREKELSEKLNNLGIANTLVLDPTLIYPEALKNFKFWNPYIKGDYVLIYEVAKCEELNLLAKKVANDLNCKVVEIKMRSKEGPDAFLNLVKHARCVVTTSFHGVAISLIYHVPVYVAKVGSHLDIRAESLLKSLNISERMIYPSEYKIFQDIDFYNVEKSLKQLQAGSKDFVNQSLGKDNR